MSISVRFSLDGEKGKPDARVRMRVFLPDGKAQFLVGYRVNRDRWISSAQRCAVNSYHGKDKVSASVINAEIQRYEELAHHVLASFGSSVPSKDEFRERFMSLLSPEPVSTASSLLDGFDAFVAEQSNVNGWSGATIKKMHTIRVHLSSWLESPSYADLDEPGMNSFVSFLLGLELKNRTITKYVDTLRWFLRWADHRGLSGGKCCTDYKVHLKDTQKRVIFLTWSELMAIFNYEFDENQQYLAHARDRFCFGCFTGLRYSDISSLLKIHVTDDAIYPTTKKDVDNLRIELNKYSKAIVDRYIDSPGDTLFPRMSSQKVNDYIKTVGKLCGLKSVITEFFYRGSHRVQVSHMKYELLTTHCGRRTFICNALMLGIPADVVMKWTGHSDYKAMRPYIDIADETKKTAMALFDEKK